VTGRLLVSFLPAPQAKAGHYGNRILFIRPGGIGDAALLIPVIQALKEHLPEVGVDILAEQRNAAVFGLCPQVDRVFSYDKGDLIPLLRSRYDVVIDTEQWHRLSAIVARLIRSRLKIGYGTNERRKLLTHAVEYSHARYEFNSFADLLKPLGIAAPETMPERSLRLPDAETHEAEQLLAALDSQAYVVLFPGASIPERRWGEEKFHQLALSLNDSGYPVVVIGGPEDRAVGETVVSGVSALNLAGRTSLLGSAALIARAALLVSGDSGMLHVGVGLGTPTVSLFGSGIAAKWAPRGERHIVLNRNLPCSPCTRFGYTPPCPIDVQCLRDITVDEVFNAVMRLTGRVDR
jgi:lipopolysaccharide heptosyltransferase II